MGKKTVKRKCGYKYACEDETWSVTTDYLNEKIYLSGPFNEAVDEIEHFGIVIGKAVADMKKDMKL